MGWREKKQPPLAMDKIENVVGRSCVVHGDLVAEGAFRVDGTIEGGVESKAAVVVGESGAVTGNVRAVDVLVAGKIHGNVVATGHLDILASGVIEGDIDAKSLRVEVGGVFAGTSRMGHPEQKGSAEVAPSLSAVR